VQHAHQKGVIHRDLKPGNVLVTLQDGRPVPKVIDFGIAKAAGQALTDKTLFTNYAQMLGTPLYMSPEQAQISGQDVDTRSDVYSLGVLLYELLTGTTPFDRQRLRDAAYDEMRRIIREEDPPKPSTRLSALGGRLTAVSDARQTDPKRLGQLVRGELDWIVMRAMDKERGRRYASPDALAGDVRRYLRDEAVQACPPSTWYRFRKFARRRKAALAVASALSVGAMLAVVALAISAILVWRANDDLRAKSYAQRITIADRELTLSDNLGAALQVLDECPPDLRTWEWFYLKRLCRVEPLVIRAGGEVSSISFSADGEWLASAAAGADGVVKIWNSRTGRLAQILKGHPGGAYSVAFHPDGRHVASAGADRQLKVWDLVDGREMFNEFCDPGHMFGAAYTVAFSPDGAQLAAGGDQVLNVWHWRTRELLHAFPHDDARAPTVAFSRDGRQLGVGTWRGTIKIMDPRHGGPPLRTFPEDQNPITAIAFSPDGGRMAQGGYGRRVNVWSTADSSLLASLRHTGRIHGVAFSPDGQRIASGGEDKTVRLWDAKTGREMLGLRGHTDTCMCVTFSPDGHRLASAGTDGTIRIWDAMPLRGGEGQEAAKFDKHSDEVWCLAVSPDGRTIASGGFRTFVEVWDATTGRVALDFRAHPFVCFDLAWHRDGRRIASAGFDGKHFTAKVWEAQSGHEVFTLTSVAETFAAAFSPDGRYLVTAGTNRAIQVWDAETGAAIGTLGTHAREIRGLAFSPDGSSLASAGGDGKVNVWDATRLAEKQEPRLRLPGRVPGQCSNIAFSPDGRRLATGGLANTVKIWDVATGDLVFTLRGHTAEVYTVAFSPEGGRWIATAGEDSTVKIWDGRTGERVRSFRGHEALVASLAFSRDGQRLYSGSRDHTVKTWDLSQLDADSPAPPTALFAPAPAAPPAP
jgi:eukaryotic-like serine/threonine-protein kinase